jgi:hypothetical protein
MNELNAPNNSRRQDFLIAYRQNFFVWRISPSLKKPGARPGKMTNLNHAAIFCGRPKKLVLLKRREFY